MADAPLIRLHTGSSTADDVRVKCRISGIGFRQQFVPIKLPLELLPLLELLDELLEELLGGTRQYHVKLSLLTLDVPELLVLDVPELLDNWLLTRLLLDTWLLGELLDELLELLDVLDELEELLGGTRQYQVRLSLLTEELLAELLEQQLEQYPAMNVVGMYCPYR